MDVASGVPPDVEGGRPAARTERQKFSKTQGMISAFCVAGVLSAGRDARLYGRQDARRYDMCGAKNRVRRDGFAGRMQHLPCKQPPRAKSDKAF